VRTQVQSQEMIQPLILLCHELFIRNALRAALQAAFAEHPFLIRDLPQVPSGIEPDEFVVSEAMKLACNDDKQVLIIGVNRSDTVEKGINCIKFDSLVNFLPHPFTLPDMFDVKDSFKNVGALKCEQKCSAFGIRCSPVNVYGNVYAGKIIYNICHDLSHIPKGTSYSMADLNDFLLIIPHTKVLSLLFKPPYNTETHLIESFLTKMKKLRQLAENKNLAGFDSEFVELFHFESDSFIYFPYLGGE